MKRILLFLTAFLLIMTLVACGDETNDDKNSESDSIRESMEDSTVKNNDEIKEIDWVNSDFDLELFEIPIHSSVRTGKESRVIFISDMHMNAFDNVGGYTPEERQQLMIDALIREYKTESSYDAVVFVGDLINNNDDLKKIRKDEGEDYVFTEEEEEKAVRMYKDTYLSQLEAEGIQVYCLNASHDSLYGDNFENIFGYERNYVLRVGTTAYICVDSFGGPRDAVVNGNRTEETMFSDIPDDFLQNVKKFLAHDYVEQAFVVSHWPADYKNVKELYACEKVLGGIAGHTHYNWVDRANGKPLLQTGHFSRGFTKMISWGLGFKPFVPLNDSVVGTTTDEEGRKNRKDYSGTGSPWQWRVMEYVKNGDSAMIESYMVFPEMNYKEFSSDGNLFPAFTQPYIEARPSFLGDSAPIDRSYLSFSVR